MAKKNEEKKSNKKKVIFIILVVVLLLIGAFLYWWFNRKFEVTAKYNDGSEDEVLYIKYMKTVNPKDLKDDLKVEGKSFVGWFETYHLSAEEIEKVKKDEKLEETICKEGFKIDSTKEKCIAEEEYNFENTKIKEEKTIEALWSGIAFTINPTSKTINEKDAFKITASVTGTNDKTVTFKSSDTKIATVDSNGKVVGVKKGTTVINVTSNGITRKCTVTVKEVVKPVEKPVDNGTISLKANDQCLIGTNAVKVTATVSNNAIDKTIKWDTNLKCYNVTKESDTVYSISRIGRGTMCRDVEEVNPEIKASLNNGKSDSLKLTYEPTLTYKVYDGSNEIQPDSDGSYSGNNISIKTNVSSNFSGNNILTKEDTTVTLHKTSQSQVTITTQCGQTATVKVYAIIN